MSPDVSEYLSKRAAAAAARELEQPKFDLIPKLAVAGRVIAVAVEARDAAERRITAGEQAYTELRQTALEAGWTAAKLAKLGFGPIKTAPHRQHRRRASTAAEPATHQAVENTAQKSNEDRTATEPTLADPVPNEPAPADDGPRQALDLRRARETVLDVNPHPDGLWQLSPRTETR